MFQQFSFLTQTDTTIGFISQSALQLNAIKKRPPNKHYIKAIDTLHRLKTFTRVPHTSKNRVRRAKKTTFILPHGDSYRVIQDKHHKQLLKRLKWAYSTSANLSGHTYEENFAKEHVDIIVTPLQNRETNASHIYKLGKKKIQRIR
jgi:tRNA A37 threonylcarbamoyladenosine synthetase subunit TsaC/SUA5/YrdC